MELKNVHQADLRKAKLLFLKIGLLFVIGLTFGAFSLSRANSTIKELILEEVFIEDSKPEESDEEDLLIDFVDAPPSFGGGGMNDFRKFIGMNLKYPEMAAKRGIAGMVLVQFVVETTGALSNFKVIKGVDPSLDAEALRVVKLSPKWNPGKDEGKKVRVFINIPIEFKLK